MISKKFLVITRLIGKHLLVALFAAALGMIVGRGIVLAESKTIFCSRRRQCGHGRDYWECNRWLKGAF